MAARAWMGIGLAGCRDLGGSWLASDGALSGAACIRPFDDMGFCKARELQTSPLSMTERAADRACHLAARSLVTNGQGRRPQKVTGGSHLCHVVSYTGGAGYEPLGIYDENKSNFPRSVQVST